MNRLRFTEAVADVVADYRSNQKRSVRDVERRIRLHLDPFFAGRRMAALTTADLRAYILWRQTPTTGVDGATIPAASNATINRELAIIKRAFRLAVQAGRLVHVPHIPMLAEHNVRQGFFERAPFDDVRAHLPEALRGLVTFAFLVGWRIASEVLPLQWAQVDRTATVIRLEPGESKNDEGRTLPYDLLPELVEIIEHQWHEHERLQAAGVMCPWVFFHRQGRPIRSFYGAWRAACEAAGVPGMIPHDFRRTAVRNLLRAGVSERVAMQITGHKTRSVFDRYDIVNEHDLRSAMGKLGTASGTKLGQSTRSGRVSKFRRRS